MRHVPWGAALGGGLLLAGGLGMAPDAALAQPLAPPGACTSSDGAPLGALPVRLGVAVPLPQGITALALTTQTGAEFPDAARKLNVPVGAEGWTPDASQIAVLSAAVSRGVTTPAEAPRLRLTFKAGGPPPCLASFTTPLPETPLGQSTRPTPLPRVARVDEGSGVTVDAGCRIAGDSVERALRRVRGRDDEGDPVVVLFRDMGRTSTDGRPCFVTKRRVREGDALYVGVYTIAGHTGAATWREVQFDPCAEEGMYPVYASLTGDESGQQATVDYAPVMFAHRNCYSTRPVITVTGEYAASDAGGGAEGKGTAKPGGDGEPEEAQEAIKVTHKHTVQQGKLYAATLQAGVIANALQDPSFGLQPGVTADTQRVFNQGPVDGGPVYVAAVVVYGFLNYIPSIFGEPRYRGRDPLRDTGFLDRIGLVAGAGLPKPGDNFFGGASFELVAGVNVLGGWHVARVTELAGGVKEGDIFVGDADAIPTRNVWRSGFRWGVTLDLRYLGRLLPTG